MTDIAPRERAALADLMAELGPEAPTLCAGWTTRDLAAHLIVRSTRIDAAPGILVPALASYTKRVQDQVARQPWPELVEKVRQLPWWFALADESVNRVEYYVHHEDVRRAQPGWAPRDLPADYPAALWPRTRMQARLALRRVPATVTVTAPGVGTTSAGRGGPDRVELVGDPGELILFLTGRQANARVQLTGPEAVTARMRTGRYGI